MTPRNVTDKKKQKGARTRAAIIQAARNIFSQYPYHVASIRMIGKEAGVEHPLISYYFPSKKKLFEVVLADICDEYVDKIGEWLDTVRNMRVSEGFMKYIDYVLDYSYKNAGPYKILALNLTQSEDITRIPGYHYIRKYLGRTRRVFEEKIALHGSLKKVTMYFNSFNLLLISFIGAGPYIARLQGIEPDSVRYRKLVKETLAYIFVPRLKEIIRSDTTETR
jgi:TetR/AcrR family transcriptional regulator